MSRRSRSRTFAGLLAPLAALLLTGACAEPTVEEIREQTQRDLSSMLRHAAKTLDSPVNRRAINQGATRAANLTGDKGEVDIFGKVVFSEMAEELIKELDARAPTLFSEANVIADIDNGKRFRFTAAELCSLVAEAKDCDEPDLKTIELDVDVTLDDDTVRLAFALAGKPSIGSVSISASRLAVELDGAKALSFVNDVNAKLGFDKIDPGALSGSWRVEVRREGSGLRVEARLQNALLEQDVKVVLDQVPSVPGQPPSPPKTRTATLRIDVPNAGLVATLVDGKAKVSADSELRELRVPLGERDLSVVAGPLTASVSSDGSGTVVIEAKTSKPVVSSIGGKTGVSATLDRDGREVVITLAPRGAETTLTLRDAARPRVEVHPEVFDSSTAPLADPVIEAELSAGLTLLPRSGDVMLEVLAGSATMKSGGQNMTVGAGQCLHAGEASSQQPSLLDFMKIGSCAP